MLFLHNFTKKEGKTNRNCPKVVPPFVVNKRSSVQAKRNKNNILKIRDRLQKKLKWNTNENFQCAHPICVHKGIRYLVPTSASSEFCSKWREDNFGHSSLFMEFQSQRGFLEIHSTVFWMAGNQVLILPGFWMLAFQFLPAILTVTYLSPSLEKLLFWTITHRTPQLAWAFG